MDLNMDMDLHMAFSNSLSLDWMLEVWMKYVTLMYYIYKKTSYYNLINLPKWDDISVILEFSVILYMW